MEDMQALAIKVEAVFYEDTVSSLVALAEDYDKVDASREESLHNITAVILRGTSTPGQMASLAAMAVVMIKEERNERRDRSAGRSTQ